MAKHKAVKHKSKASRARKDFMHGLEEVHEVMERKMHSPHGSMPKKRNGIEVEIEIESKKKKPTVKKPALKRKMKKVMHEFKEGKLHSGSKHGALVKNPKQAVAIAYSEARKARKKKK